MIDIIRQRARLGWQGYKARPGGGGPDRDGHVRYGSAHV